MEEKDLDWKFDFDWLEVRHQVKDLFMKEALPDLNAVLFLVGIQELGQVKEAWTKEEKQDLMHIAVCTVLGQEGYYEFEGLDQDGWPHYKQLKKVPVLGVEQQERLLKEKVIQYFRRQKEENQIPNT